jgi:tRNA threonylcarbamoyl adenosine modification protein YeaZ
VDAVDTGESTESEVVETGTGPNRPLGMVEEALRLAKLEREQIECVAVGLGPGSYTGIRASIALAQGWQLANGVRVLGVCSAECMAAKAHSEGIRGRIALIIDAQRKEFYLGNYALTDQRWQELAPLRLASLDEVQSCERGGELLLGPEVTNWFPAGRRIYSSAMTLGKLAVGRNDFIAGEDLQPIYLRETRFVKAPPLRKLA